MGREVKVLAWCHIPGSAQLSLKPSSGVNQPNYPYFTFQRDSGKDLQSTAGAALLSPVLVLVV